MLLLGLLLLVAAAALMVGAVYDGADPTTVEVLGRSLHTTVAGVFFTGAATMLVFLLGVWMLRASMGRVRRRRAERKEIRNRHRDSVSRLEEERTALRAENERLIQRLAGQGAGAGTAGAAVEPSESLYGDGRPDDATRLHDPVTNGQADQRIAAPYHSDHLGSGQDALDPEGRYVDSDGGYHRQG